jgi:hypothetical protein
MSSEDVVNMDFVKAVMEIRDFATASRKFAADPVEVLELLRSPQGEQASEVMCINIRRLADSLDAVLDNLVNQEEFIDSLIMKLNGGAQ